MQDEAMTARFWRPADEAAATTTAAMFIEWARATRSAPAEQQDPDSVRSWLARDPAGCAAAAARFAGLHPARGICCNLLRHRGSRVALIANADSGERRAWSRDAVRDGRTVPAVVSAAIARMSWDDLTWLAASHLLVADTRPDDRLQWNGQAGAIWPFGAWIVGATVILGGAAEPGARGFTAVP
jgi:hypothetical protein